MKRKPVSLYSKLALSYRDWNQRLTPAGWEGFDPAISFAALPSVNIFSLLLLMPRDLAPAWLTIGLPLALGAVLAWHNSRIFRANPSPLKFAKLSDPVPALREFPDVYAYLAITAALLFGSMYASIRAAA